MPLVSGYTAVLIQPPAARHKPSVVKTPGVKLFRGTTTAAAWKEWLYGGDHAVSGACYIKEKMAN